MTYEVKEQMNMEKHERFRKVAEKRVNQVIMDMNKLGKCASKASYDYTDAEVERIIDAIEQAVIDLRERFSGKKSFSLHD